MSLNDPAEPDASAPDVVAPDLSGLHPSTPLREATLEVEEHVSSAGWDQPARLFALVETGQLLAKEPELAEQLGLEAGATADALTPIEQELPPDGDLESLLVAIEWPDAVSGCAVVIERLMLPPDAEDTLPDDPSALRDAVAEHPDRQEVRLAAAVLRDGSRHSTVRARSSDDAAPLEGPDLVPGLLAALHQTLT